MNFRIQIFDADWTPVQSFGVQGDTPGTFNRPKGVSVDSERHIYVADTSFNNFQIFDETGQLLLFVGTGGSSTGEFLLPAGMYIDERDRIYVADQGNGRVQVFQFVRDPAARP
jgi:DNA-binding beta-propeller fold protein YncE